MTKRAQNYPSTALGASPKELLAHAKSPHAYASHTCTHTRCGTCRCGVAQGRGDLPGHSTKLGTPSPSACPSTSPAPAGPESPPHQLQGTMGCPGWHQALQDSLLWAGELAKGDTRSLLHLSPAEHRHPGTGVALCPCSQGHPAVLSGEQHLNKEPFH